VLLNYDLRAVTYTSRRVKFGASNRQLFWDSMKELLAGESLRLSPAPLLSLPLARAPRGG
jgi:hypothetical protein